MNEKKNVSHWIELVKQGDSVAANDLWQHYFDRLVRIVRQRIYGRDRAVSDEEDVVVSVFESFYRAAENGRFPNLADRDDLWKLLLRMASTPSLGGDSMGPAPDERLTAGGRPTISVDDQWASTLDRAAMVLSAIECMGLLEPRINVRGHSISRRRIEGIRE